MRSRLFLFSTVLFCAGSAEATTYYTAADCTFSGDGSSEDCAGSEGSAGAFSTIQEGVDSLTAGDNLQVGAGLFEERIRVVQAEGCGEGSPEEPITVSGAGVALTTLRGVDPDRPALDVRCSYWTFEEFRVQNGAAGEPVASGGGIQVRSSAVGTTLRLLEVDGQGRSGVGVAVSCMNSRMDCPSDTLIEDVYSHSHLVPDSGDAHCFLVNFGADADHAPTRTTIRNSVAHTCDGDGVQLIGPQSGGDVSAVDTLIEDCIFYRTEDEAREENAIDAKGVRGLVIRGNTMYGYRATDTSPPGAVVVLHSSSRDVLVENNVIHSGSVGLRISRGAFAGDAPEGVIVRNNLIYGSTKEGLKGFQGGSGIGLAVQLASDIEIVGNTIADCEGPGVLITADASAITFRNNLVLASGTEGEEAELNINPGIGVELDHVLLWGGDGPGEAGGVEDFEAFCPTCINLDPLLLSPKDGDYRLAEGSPAVNAGIPVDGLDTDLNSFPRDQLPDIGAFELGSGETEPGDDDDSAGDDDDSAGDDDDSAGDDDDDSFVDEPMDPPTNCACSQENRASRAATGGLLLLGFLGLRRRRLN